eukprot:214932_1
MDNQLNSIASLLEFVCNHEMYETFMCLSADNKIEQCINSQPTLFISYHIMRIKYYIHQHCKEINNNILSDNLDLILISFYYLIPKFQPFDEWKNEINSSQLINTSYNSIFYKLHQEIKIQSILLCNKQSHIIKHLINTNLKLNPDIFNFRHININNDINKNNNIEFDIINIIQILGSINDKNKNNQETQTCI